MLTNLIDQLGTSLNENTRDIALSNIDENKEWMSTMRHTDVLVHVEAALAKRNEIENVLRLPKNSIPRHYKVHIDARKLPTGDRNFTGEVEIDVLVKESTNYIILHSKTQVITEVTAVHKNTLARIEVLEASLMPSVDTLTIYFMQTLPADSEILVTIKYASLLPTFGSGFYRTSYVINGQTRWVGATQFQPAHARYAFPNYDEPEFKTVFDLKITHDISQTAVANTFGQSNNK